QGAGNAKLTNINNARLEMTLTGAVDLQSSGQTKLVEIRLAGAGNVDAKELHAETVTVNSSGAGSVSVYASEKLDANLTGVGNVEYYGNPKTVNRRISGVGSIQAKQ